MLTEIRRRAVESQNFSAMRFLKPLFSAPAPTTLASGNSAILAEARATNPAYTGSTPTTGGGGGGAIGGTVGLAVTPAGTGFSDLYAVDVDSSGNIFAVALGGSLTADVTINQYNGVTGGIVSMSPWGVMQKSDFASNNNTILIKYSATGVPQWAVSATGSIQFFPLSVKTDASGNVYVYGYATGTSVTFRNYSSGGGGGTTIVQTTAATSGATDGSDVFLYKYNASGVFQWCVTVGSTGATNETPSIGTCLAVDSAGTSYFIFNNLNSAPTFTFKNFSSVSGNVVQYTTFGQDTNAVGYRGFLCKVDTSGTFQWVSRLGRQNVGSSGLWTMQGVSVDPTGVLIAVTVYSQNLGISVQGFSSVIGGVINYGIANAIASGVGSGVIEAYIVGFTATGQGLWANRTNSSGNVIAYSVSVRNNSVVAGGFYGAPITFHSAATYGGGTITVTPYGTLSSAGGGSGGWLAKYSLSTGVCIGALPVQTISSIAAVVQVVQDASGNIYAAIDSANTISNGVTINSFVSAVGNGSAIAISSYGTTQSTKSDDTFLVKYNASLGAQWVTRLESGTGSGTGSDIPRTLAVHPTSNFVYVGGYISNLSTAPLKLYNVSGVSGGVIQYTQYATLSSSYTGAGSSRSGFLVQYNS